MLKEVSTKERINSIVISNIEGIHKNNSNLLLSSMESSKNQVGQFKLGKTLGQGTFGKVKLGTHVITGEKVFYI
jgi:serine/threonine protein kinase